ncbi:MAG: START-like domain-containing protein [Bacteroides sp.]
MKREKIHLEYPLSATSRNILWTSISTPSGLENWFADKVTANDKNVTFYWGKTEQREAEMIASRIYSFVRFRWTDDSEESDYFEIKMICNELTSDYGLEITDCAVPDEVSETVSMWNSLIAKLRRTCGF